MVTGGKQKHEVYRLLVDVVRSTYAKKAHLGFINKRIVELIFKLNVPFIIIFKAALMCMLSEAENEVQAETT